MHVCVLSPIASIALGFSFRRGEEPKAVAPSYTSGHVLPVSGLRRRCQVWYDPRRSERTSEVANKRIPFAAIAHGHSLAEAIVDAIKVTTTGDRSGLARDCRKPVVLPHIRGYAAEDGRRAGLRPGRGAVERSRAPGAPRRHHSEAPHRRGLWVEHEFQTIGRRVMLLDAGRVFDEVAVQPPPFFWR